MSETPPAVDAKTVGKTGRLALAYRDLTEIPREMGVKFGTTAVDVDLSHNALRDLRGLLPFQRMENLVLDHNGLTTRVKLPPLPGLTTLWVNHNDLTNLSVFIAHLAEVTPSLRHLSMLNNVLWLCPGLC